MFPMLRGRSLSAKSLRLFLVMYTVRHTMGVVLFGWICIAGSQLNRQSQVNRNFFLLLLLFLIVYAVSAVYNGWKLVKQYRRQRLVEAHDAASTPLASEETA